MEKKAENALRILRHVLMAMGFSEKSNNKKITEKDHYAIDPQINGRIRIYLKTGVIATEVVTRLSDEYEIKGVGEGVSPYFGSICIGVTHLDKKEPEIIKILGPIKEKEKEIVGPKKISLVDLVKLMTQKGFPVKNRTKDKKGFWGLFFADATTANGAFLEMQKLFPAVQGKIIHIDGGKSFKISDELVITIPKSKSKRINAPVADTASTANAKNGNVENLKKQVLSLLDNFAKNTNTGSEEALLKKLEKKYYLIDKKESVVKIPIKFMGTSVTMGDGSIAISIPIMIRYLKK